MQEGGRNIEATRVTAIVWRLERTLLVGITKAYAVGHILDATAQSDVMVSWYSGTVYLLLPIGVGKVVFACSIPIAQWVIILWSLPGSIIGQPRATTHQVNKLLCIEHIQILGIGAYWHITIVRHMRTGIFASLLSRDDDNAIRGTRTIDGGSRCVLQHREGFNIVRIYQCECIGWAFKAFVIQGKTINYNQWVILSIQRRATTNTNRCGTTRSATTAHHINTCHLALNHILSWSLQAMVLIIRFDSCYWTRQVIFLSCTITNNHSFIQHWVILKRNYHCAISFYGSRFVTNIGHTKGCAGLYVKFEITIRIGQRHRFRPRHSYSSITRWRN